VGSLSVRILAKLGYDVVAVTGKAELHGALRELGANRVVEREEILNSTSKPLLTARWAGAIDTVGGQMLNSLLRSVRYGGCVTACGLVAGAELSMTVYPFLLRGISLCGIASADCPYDKRVEIWRLLAHEWKPQDLESLLLEVDLEGVSTQVAKILRGEVAGRVLVRP
jgi:putative YhdH/YhfP family quinone oxidoreductase